ncbi:hypothetical protein Pcinc_018735 [Petrolisthes cinctipes]|uniref:Uncharacterized protein n=1 Tax=Petrolisthes cinctipes TaxID=88211 RepID=A0AAE1FLL8_PETCI|nr:hypothetical protein Pcinc_018735 [Petrolisthes cinctipes]
MVPCADYYDTYDYYNRGYRACSSFCSSILTEGEGERKGLWQENGEDGTPSPAEEEGAMDDPDFIDEEENEDDPLSQVEGKRRRRAGSQISTGAASLALLFTSSGDEVSQKKSEPDICYV